jgi:hypothetical protein
VPPSCEWLATSGSHSTGDERAARRGAGGVAGCLHQLCVAGAWVTARRADATSGGARASAGALRA